MKKIVLFLLVCSIGMSFFGCSKNDSNTDDAGKTKTPETSAVGDENVDDGDDNEVNDVDKESGDDTNKVTDLNIIEGTNFSEGVAFVLYIDDSTEKVAVIDKSGRILFDLTDEFKAEFEDLYYTFHYDGAFKYNNGFFVLGNKLFDKTGIIASPEKNGYDEIISGNCDGFFLALKKDESFKGDKYYIGVLNNKGEWEHELSENHPIIEAYRAAELGLDLLIAESDYAPSHVGGVFCRLMIGEEYKYYNLAKNELTPAITHYSNGEDGVYKYDSSGNKTLIIKDVYADTFFDDVFLGRPITWVEEDRYDGRRYIYDYEGNIVTDLTEFDFSTFEYGSEYYVNEHYLGVVYNDAGGRYLALINKDGKAAFEPIELGAPVSNPNDGTYYYMLDDKGFVLRYCDSDDSSNAKYLFYDYSGNVTEYKDISWFYGPFCEGLARAVCGNDDFCYIDYSGNIVIK